MDARTSLITQLTDAFMQDGGFTKKYLSQKSNEELLQIYEEKHKITLDFLKEELEKESEVLCNPENFNSDLLIPYGLRFLTEREWNQIWPTHCNNKKIISHLWISLKSPGQFSPLKGICGLGTQITYMTKLTPQEFSNLIKQ